MKKHVRVKLPLQTETVRRLSNFELADIAAGASGSGYEVNCASGRYTCGLTENSEGSWC
jgi:hypothetical protein